MCCSRQKLAGVGLPGLLVTVQHLQPAANCLCALLHAVSAISLRFRVSMYFIDFKSMVVVKRLRSLNLSNLLIW